jgi:osmotically-inducible protein OsmY
MRLIILVMAGALVSGVGTSRADPQSRDEADSAWQRAKEDFAKAYGAVKSGSEKTATAGKYGVQDLGKGVVRVTDKSKQALHDTTNAVQDSWITAKIKGEYVADEHVKARQITVTTEHGVVRLSGKVESEAEAKRAITLALETKGVVAVDSDLQYPTGYRRVAAPAKPPR